MFLPDPKKDKDCWVIEVFAGSCHLSEAARDAGYRVLAFDILFGWSCNVLLHEVQRFIIDFAHQFPVKLVWFGMPCQSWSRARKNDGGPGPLRDDNDFIWGFPDLSPNDNKKIALGNQLLSCTVTMIQQIDVLCVPWVLENPWTSRCWLTRPLRDLASQQHVRVSLCRTDFCQFNMAWRKATGLMFAHLSLNELCQQCTGSSARCSATGKRHLVLQGKDAAGVWWTHRAQAYPPAFCKLF